MAWPKGVPRRKGLAQQATERDKTLYPSVNTPIILTEEMQKTLTTSSGSIALLPDRKQFTDPVHYDEILAVRMLRKGQFAGLWELVSLDDTGKVRKVITDANSKQSVINLMTRAVVRIVA